MDEIIDVATTVLPEIATFKKEKTKKEKKEELEKQKKIIDETDVDELRERLLKEEELLEYVRDTIEKKEGDRGAEWIWNFVSFGFIVFFVSLLFFGSLDGVVFSRDVYVNTIENSFKTAIESLQNVIVVLFDAFNKLFVKFYDIGAAKPQVFYWLWVITIIWWMGYMFIYKMFKESFLTMKEFIIPLIKNLYKRLRGLKKKK